MRESSQGQLGVVVPVYNEAENILNTLRELESHVPVPTTCYVVADTEEDPTFTVLDQFEGEMVTVKPTLNGYGRGALNAIKWGLHHAEEDAVVVTMADMSDDLQSLVEMWEGYKAGYHVVCGSRYMPGGRQSGGPWFKAFLSRMAGVSLHYLTRLPTKDVTNSFKLYHKMVIENIEIESTGGFEIGMEIVVKAWTMGYRVTEVPTSWQDRTAGESRFRLWAWLPRYLHWYFYCLKSAWFNLRVKPVP